METFPEKAYLVVAADYQFTAKINGKELGSGQLHPYAFRFDIAPYLKKGVNMLKFVLKNRLTDMLNPKPLGKPMRTVWLGWNSSPDISVPHKGR